MAWRVYIVPRTGTGALDDPFRPNYISGVRYRSMPYGREPIVLVAADVTPAQHTTIAANADVLSAPADLTATIGATLATVQAKLESVQIPANWITAGMTYRTVLTWVARVFLISQRMKGQTGLRVFEGHTLTSLVGDLSPARRQALTAAAQSMGLDTSSITLAMTLRQALVILGNQMTVSIRLEGLA